MYRRPIVPPGFQPPARAEGPGFHLRMLTVHDVVKDFDAVMAAAPRLKGLLDPASDWPEGLTLEENLIDLAWHQREFTIGHSFAYTVMNADESRCLGCCYIYPAEQNSPGRPGAQVEAFYWAREPATEAALGAAFRALVARFPFDSVAWPGRDQPWQTL